MVVPSAIRPNGNRLTVGSNDRVKANVNASSVVAQGQRISIHEGAYFKGKVNIKTNG